MRKSLRSRTDTAGLGGVYVHQRRFAYRPIRTAQYLFHGMIHPPSRSPVGCVVRELTSVGAKLVVAPPSRLPKRFRLVVEAKGIDADCDVMALADGAVDVRFAG